jgi:hypothetical protein
LLLPSALSVVANEDMIVRLDGTSLVGLPRKYEPAELDLRRFTVRIHGRTKEFSPFLKSLFEQPYHLELSASWYYEPSSLPPYLAIRIFPKGRDFSYEILLDIDTVRIIQLSVMLRESAAVTRDLPVSLTSSDINKAMAR